MGASHKSKASGEVEGKLGVRKKRNEAWKQLLRSQGVTNSWSMSANRCWLHGSGWG